MTHELNTRSLAPWARLPLLLAGPLFLSSPVLADGPVIWELDRVRGEGLYSHPFALREDATLDILAVGSGLSEEDELLAYGWILDAESGEPVWIQTTENTTASSRDPENWIFDGRVDLPAGHYIAYYSTYGRRFDTRHSFSIGGVEIGVMRGTHGSHYRWKDIGNPRRWRFSIALAHDDPKGRIVVPYDGAPLTPAFIRFAPLGNDASESAAFRVSRPLEVEVSGMAEYGVDRQMLWDRAWIEDAYTRRTIWEVDDDDSWPAGGDPKNVQYRTRLELPEGEYILCASTDDSHAFDSWNASPPHNPLAWGVTMTVTNPDDADAIEMMSDPAERLLVAKLDRVPNGTFVRKAFRLLEPTRVRVVALGERYKSDDQFADYGWIEREPEKKIVWMMDPRNDEHAGGALKNRLVRDEITLESGTYMLCYVTDDSHAFGSWNEPPPRDPAMWGISVYAMDRAHDPALVELVEAKKADPAIVLLAPNGDSSHRRQVMKLPREYRLRLVAVGEGIGGRMYDYAWIEDIQTGQVVWKMRYEDTQHAGGAAKNRYVDTYITLGPGAYRVHYRTDGSHSFELWNDDRPNRPELWGIAIYSADDNVVFD